MKRFAVAFLVVVSACVSGYRPPATPPPPVVVEPPPPVMVPPPPPPPPLSTAGEQGPLRRSNLQVLDAAGGEWRYAGFTDFSLFKRFVDGENLQPLLTDRIALGATTVRVLLTAAALFDLRPTAFTDAQLDAFLELLAARGLRCECVVLVDANPEPQTGALAGLVGTAPSRGEQQALLDRIAPVLGRHWNAIGELCNECDHGITRVNVLGFERPVGGILWERGSRVADRDPFLPAWDVIGDHPGRVDEWPRRINCKDVRENTRVPCWENEPMGAAESDQPGRRAGVRADRDRDREIARVASDFAQMAAAAALLSNGALFHSDGGILSAPLGPVQTAAARAFFTALRWVPTSAPSWPYQRGACNYTDAGELTSCPEAGIGNMPILHDDRRELRSFCKGTGAESWCVQLRTNRQHATPRDGWRVVEEPAPGLVRLAR